MRGRLQDQFPQMENFMKNAICDGPDRGILALQVAEQLKHYNLRCISYFLLYYKTQSLEGGKKGTRKRQKWDEKGTRKGRKGNADCGRGAARGSNPLVPLKMKDKLLLHLYFVFNSRCNNDICIKSLHDFVSLNKFLIHSLHTWPFQESIL